MIRIKIYESGINSLANCQEPVYEYICFWIDGLDSLTLKRKDFASKVDAVNFAKKRYQKRFPPPFIIKKITERRVFRSDVVCEPVNIKNKTSILARRHKKGKL